MKALPAISLALATTLQAQTFAPKPAQPTPEAEIAAVLQRFKASFAAQEARETKAAAPAKATLIKELSKLRDDAKAKGNLDGVLEVETALKAAEEGASLPTGKLFSKMFAQLQSNYDRARDAALKTYAPGRARLEADYERTMSDMEQKFTRIGNVDAAQKVREARKAGQFVISSDVLASMQGIREDRDGVVVVTDSNGLITAKRYRPAVEIEYVLKTDSQVRIGYAADTIIVNWEIDNTHLRIDGGPVSGQHRPGVGAIPKNEWVTIRQVVRPKEMIMYVNGQQRARWSGDFGAVDAPIRILPAGATLQVKAVHVRKPR